MNDNANANATQSQRLAEKVEVSIQLDSDLLDQLKHLSEDPSRIIETAIKQWLRGERERDDDLTRTFRRNPPVPPRGEWND
ncbi:type II toxin-antitoxin system CcdA family antitoxin [Spirulina sp. CS-785/01]|uniref:type II toxin-antitoxin system CcdA family antitoxin n=1 Tax=Spirulina sp. CS-785/01 TaxID=3021716 RepID=UPI00233098A8|nr:type II toxin-antitoxin system CcdA family antitoxin [Spirulina sp. CS-785/01]MDB9315501.1 type II toxin-antitoxin system CcdA family antitoxin [Spirulina sp. CS-785/01]